MMHEFKDDEHPGIRLVVRADSTEDASMMIADFLGEHLRFNRLSKMRRILSMGGPMGDMWPSELWSWADVSAFANKNLTEYLNKEWGVPIHHGMPVDGVRAMAAKIEQSHHVAMNRLREERFHILRTLSNLSSVLAETVTLLRWAGLPRIAEQMEPFVRMARVATDLHPEVAVNESQKSAVNEEKAHD